MPQPKNVATILRWCELHRPDLLEYMNKITSSNDPQMNGFILLMTTSFEAGRMFQSEHHSPGVYDIHEVPY